MSGVSIGCWRVFVTVPHRPERIKPRLASASQGPTPGSNDRRPASRSATRRACRAGARGASAKPVRAATATNTAVRLAPAWSRGCRLLATADVARGTLRSIDTIAYILIAFDQDHRYRLQVQRSSQYWLDDAIYVVRICTVVSLVYSIIPVCVRLRAVAIG